MFDIGEIVQLKSGGPAITVTALSTSPGRTPLYVCQWMDKDHRAQTGTFPREALTRPLPKKRPIKAGQSRPSPTFSTSLASNGPL